MATRAFSRGFSLVELMVAVAIVSILAAMVLSQFKRLECRSKQSEAKMLLRGLYQAEQAYASDFGEFTGPQVLYQYGFELTGPLNKTKYYQLQMSCSPLAEWDYAWVVDDAQRINQSSVLQDYWFVAHGESA